MVVGTTSRVKVIELEDVVLQGGIAIILNNIATASIIDVLELAEGDRLSIVAASRVLVSVSLGAMIVEQVAIGKDYRSNKDILFMTKGMVSFLYPFLSCWGLLLVVNVGDNWANDHDWDDGVAY